MFGSLKSMAEGAASKASEAASQAKAVAEARVDEALGPKCFVCLKESKDTRAVITCVCCLNVYCEEHKMNLEDGDCGISKKRGGRYCIPVDLKAEAKSRGGVLAGAAAMIAEAAGDGMEYACPFAAKGETLSCKQKCVNRFMEAFKKSMEDALRLEEFKTALASDKLDTMRYKLPESIDDGFKTRAAMLAMQGANKALGFMSWEIALIGNLVVYGVKAKVLIDMLRSSFGVDDRMIELIFSMKKPVIYSLRNLNESCDPKVAEAAKNLSYSEIAKNIVPTVFYLSREHMLGLRTKDTARLRLSDEMVTLPAASDKLLEWIQPCFGPANWLYKLKLPGVHSSDEWTRWYLSEVLAKEGWSVVGASVKTEVVPQYSTVTEEDETNPGHFVPVESTIMVPAFAVVTRGKEAMVVVRGTQSMADWTININMVPKEVTYYQGKDGDSKFLGQAHAGMTKGAEAIINLCGVGKMVDDLLLKGYSIKVVGHSLGAGISCMIAILLKAKYAEEREEGKRDDVPFIPSVGFGHPPCVDTHIAQAAKEDGLCTAIVNEYDVVCRLSEFNFAPLAEEVFLFRERATKVVYEDIAAFKAYSHTLGAASRINAKVAEEKAEGKGSAMKMEEDEEVDEAEVAPAEPSLTIKDSREREKNLALKVTRLAVPGDIVLFGTLANGKVKAALCPHDAATLKTITLVDSIVDDHDMAEYSKSMQMVTFDRMTSSGSFQSKSVPDREDARDDRGNWRTCSICSLDVTWPYITKSNACRASATTNCQRCGKICCVVCAPAGDQIPAEAMATETLSDRRIPLATYGLHTPQRVCYPCYFHNHEV